MKVFITGATGFLGSHLVTHFVNHTNHDVSIIKRLDSNVPFSKEIEEKIAVFTLKDDASNLVEIIKDAQPEVVIHLATHFLSGHEFSDITPLINANVTFGSKLCEAMVANDVKFLINTGTLWEYFKGDDQYDPVNFYAATKKAFEEMLQFYVNAKNLEAISLKFYDTYGPDDRRGKLFSYLKQCLAQGESIDFSAGEQTLDIVYIDDVVKAYEGAVEYILTRQDSVYEVIPIGSGKSVRLKDIVATFEEVTQKTLDIRWGAREYRPREVMHAQADIRKAQDKLKWSAQVSLKDGITQMLTKDKII